MLHATCHMSPQTEVLLSVLLLIEQWSMKDVLYALSIAGGKSSRCGKLTKEICAQTLDLKLTTPH